MGLEGGGWEMHIMGVNSSPLNEEADDGQEGFKSFQVLADT